MFKKLITLALFSVFVLIGSCQNIKKNEETTKQIHDSSKMNYAYFASGCFWCVEAIFESVDGVHEAISGYSGGTESNPTYQTLGSHAETVMVYYDSTIVDFPTLVDVYYGSQDPTTIGQKPDFGAHYRSIIFYQNNIEKQYLEGFKSTLNATKKYAKHIVTEIVPFKKFWKAEEYHQNYERLHPNQAYVKSVSIPRLKKFQSLYPELLKKK